ncbi:MAG TPA: hypothetical protein VFY43_05495 [Candidatus Limnocylindria bacterium]|nr:hypothetical protein [Candidatus Limnocylindria bacterium]
MSPVRETLLTPLKRQYPHVDAVEDWRAQQSLRLLWDRVFSLEERLQAQLATQGDLVDAVNANEDRLGQVQRVAGEALAIAQRTAGEAGEGGAEESNEFGKIGKGSAPPTVALADLSGDVDAYAAAHATDLANSCLSAGGTRAYIDGLVAYLQAIDPRVGGNGKRGNMGDPSEDAIAYYHGVGSPPVGSNDVYVVDVIGNHCPVVGAAGPAWNDVTTSKAYGAWRSDALP